MSVERYPLSWPTGWVRTAASQRLRVPFKTEKREIARSEALRRLMRELARIGATDEVLSTNWELRLDGSPRLDRAEPGDSGVAVYFKFKKQPRVLACDRYITTAGNVAAIAAHIEAVRRIDRYGVGTMEQAFAGYKALTAQASPWWTVLEFKERPSDYALVDRRYTELMKRHHPDRGGSADIMAKINAARDAARIDLEVLVGA